jgi:putative transposase
VLHPNPPRRPSLVHSTNLSVVTVAACLGSAVNNFTLPSGKQRKLARLHLGELPAEARRRLKWFDWHETHGQNVSLTCRHFGIGRQTFYRWQKRFDRWDLQSLADRSSRPSRTRQRTWTTAEVLAVKALREHYPFWGKLKLAVLLLREGVSLSASRIGRILAYLKRRGELKEPLRRSLARRRQWKRQYATRKPKNYEAMAPGDIVQIDTMDVRPEPGVVLKQFTTVDVVSRWSVPTIASNATAKLASRALDELIARSPFAIKAIQVDGGSEFMAEFEDACETKGILLFELPPRSPKLNGRVERANRTYREELYDCSTATPTVAGLAIELREWEHTYNHIRPHQALGYLTPAQFLATLNAAKPQEGLSRT